MTKYRISSLILVLSMAAVPAAAQQQEQATVQLTVEPAELTLALGEKATLTATVKDADGNVIDRPVLFFSQARRSVSVTAATGEVEALRPGEFFLMARVPAEAGDGARGGRGGPAAAELRILVTVPFPAVTSIDVTLPGTLYAGTIIRPEIVIHADGGGVRTDIEAGLRSDNSSVIEVTPLGLLKMVGPGSATISAGAETITEAMRLTVEENPAASVRLEASATEARTGYVIHFVAAALDGRGCEIAEMPIEYTFRARTVDHELGSASSGLITEDGRFVADLAGEYTIVASAGNTVATASVSIEPRNARRMLEVVGRGRVADRKTSDLWVWEGPNGRDYAVTGTWAPRATRTSGMSPTRRTSTWPPPCA